MPEILSDGERKAIASLVKRRRATLRQSIDAIAASASVSPVTWGNVEAGRPVRDTTYAAVEQALGWNIGAISRFVTEHVTPRELDIAMTPTSNMDLYVSVALELEVPDTVKVQLLKVLQGGGDPIDAALALDTDATIKVQVIAAWRQLQAIVANQGTEMPADSRLGELGA